MNLLTAAALTRIKGEMAKDGREPSSSSKGSFEAPPSGRMAGSGMGGKKGIVFYGYEIIFIHSYEIEIREMD